MIPVILPKRNANLDFIRTVGDLYFQNGNHTDLAKKKLLYFREHIRTHYHYLVGQFSTEAADRLARSSGKSEKQLLQLFRIFTGVEAGKRVSSAQLLELQKHLDIFHERTN